MKKRATKAVPVDVLGNLSDDAVRVRQCLNELGWSQARLADKVGLSLVMISAFLNGKKRLSPAASDRVMTEIAAGFDDKKAADKPRISPEQAVSIRERATKLIDEIPEEVHQYQAFLDVRNAVDPFGEFSAREALISLGGPPRDPVAYEAWKAKQLELHAAAKELPVAKAWIAHQDKRVAALMKTEAVQKEIISNLKEIAALREGQVNRLRQQLRDAGIAPTD
jgi:transcriptional regulator with XRE-family HTH domain